MVAQHLLLDFLADRHQQKDTALSLSARTFLTCRLFADELTSLRAAAALTQQQQAQLLVKYHNTSEQLEKGLVCDLNAGGLASYDLHSLFAGEGSSLLLVSWLDLQSSYAECQWCSQLRPPCKHWPSSRPCVIIADEITILSKMLASPQTAATACVRPYQPGVKIRQQTARAK